MSNAPKTQTVDGVTYTWKTLKGVEAGARIGFAEHGPAATRPIVATRTIESTKVSQGRTITFTDGTTEWGGVATKYWVAPATLETILAPKAPRGARIPADATTHVCAACGTDKPVTAFPTVTGPQDRTTTCRACRRAAKAA